MSLWVLNNNASNHRGVWHIATGPSEKETIPERVTESVYDVRVLHATDACPWYYGRPDGYYFHRTGNRTPPDCTCGVGNVWKRGDWTSISIFPEHEQWKTMKVLCNQVDISPGLAEGMWLDGTPWDRPAYPGERRRSTYEYQPLHTKPTKVFSWEGDIPPGPTCSRCLKKSDVATQ